MATILTTIAKERSTLAVICSFTDEDDAAVVPNSIKWSLTDESGTVINSRDQVVVGSPASSITIVLSGADLQILTAEAAQEYAKRSLVIEAEYDSSLGSSLPLTDQLNFVVENLSKIT